MGAQLSLLVRSPQKVMNRMMWVWTSFYEPVTKRVWGPVGEWLPDVMVVRTEHSEVRTEMTKGYYSTLQLNQATTKTGRRRVKKKHGCWLQLQTSTILVMWLCLSDEKGERMWSHSSAWFNNGVFCKQQRATLIHGKSIHESFRGSILDSIIAEFKRKLSIEVFWFPRKWLTPKCEQQAEPANSARRKECDHMRLAFRFDKQSHVTEIIDVWHHSQLSLFSLNLQSTCFGSRLVY